MIRKAIVSNHQSKSYDALFFIGLLAPFRINKLKIISWSQGSPLGEASWFFFNAISVIQNRSGYLLPGLMLIYFWKIAEAAFSSRFSNIVIVGSRWSAGVHEKLGIHQSRLIALPYPVDLKMFCLDNSVATSKGEFRFLHLGRLVPRKRIDLLLKAFAIHRKDYPESILYIVGKFAYGSSYRRLLVDPMLNQGVIYTEMAPRNTVPDLIKNSDCLIQSSENENFGSAVAEALACGRPVIIGPTNGTSDYIGKGSLIFKDYTTQSIANAMTQIVRNVTENRIVINKSAREAEESSFDLNLIVDRVCKLIR